MFRLEPEEIELYQSIVPFARSLRSNVKDADRTNTFERDLWTQCAAQGVLAGAMPEAFGGTPATPLQVVLVFQALGFGCADNGLAFSLASQFTSVQIPVAHHGTAEVRERYLPGLINGTLIGAHAASEPDAGSDLNAVRTVARRVEGGFRLTGSKIFSTLAPQSSLAIVLAKVDDGSSPLAEFVVPRDQYSVSPLLEKIGLRTAPLAEVILEDAFVPTSHLLGSVGSGLLRFMTTMEWERLVIMAPSLGAMERQLEQVIHHAREREQFGSPIGKFQGVSHRIVDMKLRLETSRLLLYSAASKKAAEGRAAMESAMVKLHLSESRYANAIDAIRIFGAYGCLTDNEVERELRDAIPGLIYSGTSEIQRNTIARLLGL